MTSSPEPNLPITLHAARVLEKAELRRIGHVVTKPSYVWRIECSEILTRYRAVAVHGLRGDATHVWLFTPAAKKMIGSAMKRGLRPGYLRTEYRKCARCKRLMLGLDAQAHRALIEASSSPQDEPCGPTCTARMLERRRAQQSHRR